MPKIAVPLTDLRIKRAKPGNKVVKLYDGTGLYLEVPVVGAKTWRFRFRQANGRENVIALGPYPEVSLEEARTKRGEMRRLLRDGVDPLRHREGVRRAAADAQANTFESMAREWHTNKIKSWSVQYAKNVLGRLEIDIFPSVGSIPINEITHREMIDALRKIEARGAHEVAKRNKAVCSQVFSYAIQAGVGNRNPIADMKDVLQAVTPGNFLAISCDQLPVFLRVLRENEACMHRTTRIGLRLLKWFSFGPVS